MYNKEFLHHPHTKEVYSEEPMTAIVCLYLCIHGIKPVFVFGLAVGPCGLGKKMNYCSDVFPLHSLV